MTSHHSDHSESLSESLPETLPETLLQPQQPQVQPAEATTRRLPGWRLWLPLLFQVGLVVAVPAQDAYTYATGKQITLQTAPVDPYDLLRGHYQILSYDISQPDQLRQLPGGNWFDQQENQQASFYVILEAPADASATPPQPWKPVGISGTRPEQLPENQVAIQGQKPQWGRITYGLETYYMPEAERNALNANISQQQGQQAFVVDVKVDASGNAVPISLWVRDQEYRF
ncbi:MAG: GDYXXLXY domain-containing protein [Cyanobacteria bacterium RM1_2_2]|nr:GDYXXLXY domain-containing protein [Cyanobacteria bacterium RM1_2_2]